MACVKPGFQNDSTGQNYLNLVLYWFPFSGSLAPMAVLEEAGVSYEKTLIDISKGEHLLPEYLKIHPLGLVPAFRLENGKYIFESAGICMYLADLFPENKLALPFGSPERGVYNQWMFFLSSSIYPTYGRIAHPEWCSVDSSHSGEIKVAAITEQKKHWLAVEKELENRSWLVGEKFSTADIYLLMLSTWDEDKKGFARMFPNVTRVATSAAKRRGVQRALRLHSV